MELPNNKDILLYTSSDPKCEYWWLHKSKKIGILTPGKDINDRWKIRKYYTLETIPKEIMDKVQLNESNRGINIAEVNNLLKIMKNKKAGPEYKKALHKIIEIAQEKSKSPVTTLNGALKVLDYIEPKINESLKDFIPDWKTLGDMFANIENSGDQSFSSKYKAKGLDPKIINDIVELQMNSIGDNKSVIKSFNILNQKYGNLKENKTIMRITKLELNEMIQEEYQKSKLNEDLTLDNKSHWDLLDDGKLITKKMKDLKKGDIVFFSGNGVIRKLKTDAQETHKGHYKAEFDSEFNNNEFHDINRHKSEDIKVVNKSKLNEDAHPGSIVSIDMFAVRKYMGDVPQYIKLLKKVIEKGNGKVEIVEINPKEVKIKPAKMKDFKQDVFVPREALITEQKEERPLWTGVFQKGNEVRVLSVNAKDRDEAIRELMMSRSTNRIDNSFELIRVEKSENNITEVRNLIKEALNERDEDFDFSKDLSQLRNDAEESRKKAEPIATKIASVSKNNNEIHNNVNKYVKDNKITDSEFITQLISLSYSKLKNKKLEEDYKSNKPVDEDKISRILQSIDNKVWNKLGFDSGNDVQENWDKYKSTLFNWLKANVHKYQITRPVALKLESENYHSLLKALKELGYIKQGVYENKTK